MTPKDPMWPYSRTLAIVSIPIAWILFAVLFSLTHKYANWPDAESRNSIVIVAIVVSFIPLLLVLLDFLSSRRAVLDIKGVKIDFGWIDLSQAEVRHESFGLPDNIGIAGAIVSDSSPMQIVSALQEATANEVVLLDIKDGNAWWVTRLLALSAGAVRAGSPKAFVFVGMKENIQGQFLGWAEPASIQKAILNAREPYQTTYQTAMRIARQIAMFGANDLLPAGPSGFVLHSDVTRYTYNPDFVKLGDAAFEQILMDQLAKQLLENPPDRLTLGRLMELFGHCLYQHAIDLLWPNEKQISSFLDSTSVYVALLKNGKYESLVKREDGERLIIRELFLQSQHELKQKSPDS